MSILVSQKILDCIRDELSASRESFLLISAYCKLPLVKYFDSCIVNTSIEKSLSYVLGQTILRLEPPI